MHVLAFSYQRVLPIPFGDDYKIAIDNDFRCLMSPSLLLRSYFGGHFYWKRKQIFRKSFVKLHKQHA